jgi:hypothetical protein
MINTFYKDLDLGKKVEKTVLEIIKIKYPQSYIEKGYCKEWDIFIPELNFGVEVKSDKKSKYTGNIVIEIKFNNKPSALSTTKAKYWVIYDGFDYNWFLVNDIKKCIKDNNLKHCNFIGKGDTKHKDAYLIKKELLYKYKQKIEQGNN